MRIFILSWKIDYYGRVIIYADVEQRGRTKRFWCSKSMRDLDWSTYVNKWFAVDPTPSGCIPALMPVELDEI